MNEFRVWLYEWCGEIIEPTMISENLAFVYHDGWYAIWDGESVVVG